MNKNNKIIIPVIFITLVIIIVGIVAYKLIDVMNRENFKVKIESVIPNPVDIKNNEENEQISNNFQRYSKIIDNIKLELDIPNDWQYEEILENEENDFYKYALKIYKDNEKKYAMLYFYNNQFGVCGTGRISEIITLNNGKEATVGYYDVNKEWNDISFFNINKNIAIVNYGLVNDDANEIISFIKTINIT